MGDPFREVQRLELFETAFDGLEAFSVSARMSDFIGYYFSRFISNVKHSFKDFTHSELEIINKRYERQITLTLTDPLLTIDDLRVSIPKGMLLSYSHTLDQLLICLSHIQADKLVRDVESLTNLIYVSEPDHIPKPFYTKQDFERDKKNIGSLYNPTSLSYSLGKTALSSLAETKQVNDTLLTLTRDYYPQVIKLNKQIDALETVHQKTFGPIEQSTQLRNALMGMAYRVSILAVIMDHLQTMEHAFVTTLTLLKDTSKRHG